MVETFTFTVVVAALVLNVLNFFKLRKMDKDGGAGGDWCCRYPDTNVRDILIDYELEKAKKLDDAIHKIEDIEDEK